MKKRASRLLESKDLQLFRKLLRVLGDYSTSVPMTGVDRLFDIATEIGIKILPKDKHALAILKYVLSCGSTASSVQALLNHRFSGLPAEVKPMAKDGRRNIIASWSRDGSVSDRVKDLIDWGQTGKQGVWSNIDGEKVELIDTVDEDEETK